ncbi:hypothetical protein KVT40_005808 [Elsinoe batatas]|uniref:Uncharacterized protein n=1 Tax=Elsinoe batatas TaxID=2601811 RepID=A0A8K0PGY2_9PEZI|nr:hypothetical protein KVT40_005808 [Elsinoe batatas]
MADRLITPLSSLKVSTAPPVSDSWEDDSSPSDHETTSPPSPSQTKAYPRAPPPTPATTSPTVPSTDWGAASSKFRTIDGALDEREEDNYMASRAAKPSGRKDSAREREKEKEDGAGARKWQEYSSSSSGGGDPRSGPIPTTRGSGDGSSDKRPEKSTAVASRLIAAGLGVKAPRRTEEQREYDKAMRAQEAKKREREREEERRRKEESERAKRAIWDD